MLKVNVNLDEKLDAILSFRTLQSITSQSTDPIVSPKTATLPCNHTSVCPKRIKLNGKIFIEIRFFHQSSIFFYSGIELDEFSANDNSLYLC